MRRNTSFDHDSIHSIERPGCSYVIDGKPTFDQPVPWFNHLVLVSSQCYLAVNKALQHLLSADSILFAMLSQSFLVVLLAAIAASYSVVLGFSLFMTPMTTRSSMTVRPTLFDATTITTTSLHMSTKMDEGKTETPEETTTTKKEEDEPVVSDAKAKMTAMMKPIKEAGPAGALSLFLWEGAFWALAIPVSAILYYQSTGSWPDWSQKEDVAKVVGEAVVFANIARFALPVRVGLAVATTPWVKENIVDRFGLFQDKKDAEES